jgi:hypothetical protein
VRLVNAKYMRNGVFSGPRVDRGHNFEKVSTRLSTCSNGGSFHKVGGGRLTQLWSDV